MLNNKKIVIVAILACLVSFVSAQTTSPYSRYGYGILRDQNVGPSKGMGGIGYGLRNNQSANPLNPASYSTVDSLTFLFDVGVSFSKAKLTEGNASQSDNNGGLDYVTMLMPLSKRIGLSLGLIPYSSAGYSFGKSETEGVNYTATYTGSGGLSQVYGGIGYRTPVEGLSVGANASFLFGTLEHTSALPFIENTNGYNLSRYTELTVKTVKFDLGIQYEKALSKKNLLTIGAVYTPQMKSTGKYTRRTYVTGADALLKGDTLTASGVDAGLPATYGLGFTLTHNQKLLVGADVTYQKWSDVKYTSLMGDELTDKTRFNDRWKVSVGGEYMVNPYERSFFKRTKFRGGLNYSNSYLNFKDKVSGDIKGYKEYGATIGFGFPIRERKEYGGRTSYLNLNFEYRKVKPEVSSMISEEYFGVSLNVNINEIWFFRRKAE